MQFTIDLGLLYQVLAGVNGSGKTTLLDIPVLLGDILDVGLTAAFLQIPALNGSPRAQSLQELVHHQQGNFFSFALEVALPENITQELMSSSRKVRKTIRDNPKKHPRSIRYELRFEIFNQTELQVRDEFLYLTPAQSNPERSLQSIGQQKQDWTTVIKREGGQPTILTPEFRERKGLLTRLEGDVLALENVLSDMEQFPATVWFRELLQRGVLGVEEDSLQFGILGEAAGRKIALDLNQTHTISLFGVQGAGKSYTLGSILEMACLPVPNINKLPSPLATVFFHYSPTEDYKPEFTSMIRPNSNAGQIAALSDRYGAKPSSLKDVVILTSAAKVKQRQAEYPDIQVLPIAFASSELKIPHWKFLMGAIGSQNLYLRQINLIMKNLRDRLTLNGLLEEIERSSLADHLKDLAKARLNFATEYINEQQPLAQIIRPGRLIIVDLRDEFIEKDEALGLFVVMLQIFSDAVHEGHPFNKLIVFDEAHKYVESPDLVSGLVEVVREMRHKGTSLLIASQDPASVPTSLIELSSQVILHRFNSPTWLKHLQKAITVLNALTPEKMSQLGSGEAYIWSSKASDDGFVRGAIKVHCRPRITQHGGTTKTAT